MPEAMIGIFDRCLEDVPFQKISLGIYTPEV